MKINKIFLMAGLAVMGLVATSCSDDDKYTPGKEAGSNNVVFVNEANQTLALTATEFEVELQRTNTSGDLTVPLEVIECSNVLSFPESVTFASGSATATIKVAVSADAVPYDVYTLRVRIPEDYTNSYIEQAGSPQLNVTVMKEDYKPFATADYTSWFFGDTWEIGIEYSEYLDMYRIKGLFVEGYDYFYKLGAKADDGSIPMTMCTADGKKLASQATGYVHATYGMVSSKWLDANFTGYDPAEDAYFIPFQFNVSAGTFGSNYDSFKIK
jgi:hypothetical protein